MPYARVERPSLALGLLQAILERNGFSAETVYGNILFCERLGIDLYELGAVAEDLVDDWTFAQVAFPDFKPDSTKYLEQVMLDATRYGLRFGPEERIETMLQWRRLATEFLDDLARQVVARRPQIVGCSSTCSSHVACLALLKRVRDLSPGTVTMMGGASCETVMGLATHEMFPWVDYVVSGEADDLIVELVNGIEEHGRSLSPEQVPEGVFAPVHRETDYFGLREQPPRAVCHSLDKLPMPKYDDYFAALMNSPILGEVVKPGLVIEGSRGCWWGQRNACSFCALNGTSLEYRVKSSDQIVRELEVLAGRHGITRFQFVDNILEPIWFQTLFPRIAGLDTAYSFRCETTPILTRNQIKTLSEAGVTAVQPGIENLDPEFLGLINKVSKAWHNVRFLKWCLYYGIDVSWWVLFDAPGEDKEWYARSLRIIQLLYHLQPPRHFNLIRYTRFSKYHTEPNKFCLKLEPLDQYSVIYPLSQDQIPRLAFFFEDEDREKGWFNGSRILDRNHDLAQLAAEGAEWDRLFYSDARPVLEMRDTGRALYIRDTRSVAVAEFHRLTGNERTIYLACEEGAGRNELYTVLRDHAVSASEVDRIVADLVEKRLLLLIDDRLLALAIPKPLAQVRRNVEFPGGWIDRMLYEALTHPLQEFSALG